MNTAKKDPPSTQAMAVRDDWEGEKRCTEAKELLTRSYAAFEKLSVKERSWGFYNTLVEKKSVLSKKCKGVPQYQLGEPVIVCSENLYYIADITEITKWNRTAKDPCYRILHRGWQEYDPKTEWLKEWDMSKINGDAFVAEHLMAHYWNVHLLQTDKKISEKRKVGLFRMTSRQLSLAESMWQSQLPFPHFKSFAQWMGLE